MKSLSHEYSIKLLCQMTGVSRAGYYKWLGRGPSPSAIRRREILDAVEKVHQEHPTHGYRWIAAFLRLNRGIDVLEKQTRFSSFYQNKIPISRFSRTRHSEQKGLCFSAQYSDGHFKKMYATCD